MRFGEKLSFLRKQRGMTQMELAEKLDISRQAVSRWERGTADPSMENLTSIGKLFNVSVDTLIDENLKIQEGKTVQVAVMEQEPDNSVEHGRGNDVLKLMRQVAFSTYLLISVVAAVIIICFALFYAQKKGTVPMEDLEQEKVDIEIIPDLSQEFFELDD